MKYGFIIPLLDEYDVSHCQSVIDKACNDCNVDYDIIFALNSKLNAMFTKIRNEFIENKRIKAFMVDRPVDHYKLITLAMEKCENYDATIIYSAKEEINLDVIKAFIISHQAGNKIVYLNKVYRGYRKVLEGIKNFFYKIGLKLLNIFKDINAETDIQLLDNDVVKTINQLPGKNRQLRTLDALLYYATDIIHLEVDPKAYINKLYLQKGKKYKRCAIVSYVSLAVALSCMFVSILGFACGFTFHYLIHVFMWLFAMLGIVLSLVFFTRKILFHRVGENVEPSEYIALKDKIEYYNMV